MGILSSIFGAARGAEPPDAHVVTEEGFVDVDLAVTAVATDGAGIVSATVQGKAAGVTVGFIVDVYPEWKPQKVENADAVFYWGKVRYRSVGAESDRFVSFVAGLYGVSPASNSMVAQVIFSAVGLNNDPRRISEAPIRMKLFYEADAEDGYAEVYSNFDLKAKRFEFHEKDPEYRRPLIRALSEGV